MELEKPSRLFDFTTQPDGRESIVPHYCDEDDTDRLTGQNKKILDLLRIGPVRNIDLITIALKYTSRVSEIRNWLCNKTIVCRKIGKGVTEYRIDEIKSFPTQVSSPPCR